MAVVAAFKLDYLVASGEGAPEAEHSHTGFGTAVYKADHLNAGHSIDHHLRQGVL